MQPSNTFKIYLLDHKEYSAENNEENNCFVYVNLNNLKLPIENTNDLAENRIFLMEESFFDQTADYIGVLTARYEQKYPDLLELSNFDQINRMLEPNKILAAAPTKDFYHGNWIEWSQKYHKTIENYMEEMANIMQLPLVNYNTFWANNFICHRSIFFEFIKVFKNVFFQMHKRHGYDMDYEVDDQKRKAAYLYERVAMIYFSNRTDLIIEQIPERTNFNFDKILWIASAASNYEKMTKIWLHSLIDIGVKPQHIILNKIDPPIGMELTPAFRADIWYYCIKKRIQIIIDILKNQLKSTTYQYFIVCDCDIQFFASRDSVWKSLFKYLDSTDFDMFFQPEEDVNICAGFYIIKKDKLANAIMFLEKVNARITEAKNTDMPFADQTIIINMIQEIKACVLPSAICVQGPQFNPNFKDTYLFHHAIAAYDMPSKLKQIDMIKNFMNSN